MKKIIIIGILFCIFSSCGTYKRSKFEYQFGEKRAEWINMYKTEMFFTCLRKSYENPAIFNLIAKEDLQVPYEPILSEYDKINLLSTKIIKNIPKPIYPNWDDCTEKEKQEQLKKNYFCATCLNYYASSELDSIAKKAYKNFLKTERNILKN